MSRYLKPLFLPVLSILIFGLCGGCNKSIITAPSNVPPATSSSTTSCTPPQANNQLGSSLYNVYDGQSGNVLFSPYSIITCLAMAQEGAVGPTQAQMQKVLNLNPNAQARWTGFQQLISQINSPTQNYTLATADNLWPQQGFALQPAFLNTLQTYYDAGVTDVDYVGNAAGAVQTIDGAVSQETDGYIPQLLTPSDVNSKTRFVLTNAIYFNADWQSGFDPSSTTQQNFILSSGISESVSMMNQTVTGIVGSYNGAASVMALPYKGNGASMYLFLPPPGGLANLESQLTGANVNSWLAANATTTSNSSAKIFTSIALSLPKFTFSTQYDLTKTLSSLGMPLAFQLPGPNGSGANFSGIDGNLDLYISKVVHQAYISVDEKGTTAAAATGVIGGAEVTIASTVIPFVCDHPFVFMIVDNASNTVLFMGRVADPLSNI